MVLLKLITGKWNPKPARMWWRCSSSSSGAAVIIRFMWRSNYRNITTHSPSQRHTRQSSQIHGRNSFVMCPLCVAFQTWSTEHSFQNKHCTVMSIYNHFRYLESYIEPFPCIFSGYCHSHTIRYFVITDIFPKYRYPTYGNIVLEDPFIWTTMCVIEGSCH